MENKKIQRVEERMIIMDIFHDMVNPQLNYANKGNLNAAEWLVNHYDPEKVANMARYACSIQDEPYSPTITTPFQLKEKLTALIKFYNNQQRKNKKPGSDVIIMSKKDI